MDINGPANLSSLRDRLKKTQELTRQILLKLCEKKGCEFLNELKFKPLGWHPVELNQRENIIEQINLHVMYMAAVDGLEILMKKHPGEQWILEPGYRGKGHDIVSKSGKIAAEVLIAVDPGNNLKLQKDIEKIKTFSGPHKYVIYRCADEPCSEKRTGRVTVISLGPMP
jgi:hypothetical protein